MKYIELDLELIDDVIMGDFAGQDESSTSLSYISGSAIRGAIIYKLLQSNKYSEEEIFEKVIKSDVNFLNGYKIDSNKRSMPAPLCFATDKLKQRIQENSPIYNVLSDNLEQSNEQRVRIKVGDFIGTKDNRVYSVKVQKRDALHIKTKGRAIKESTSQSEMYRVEAIEKNQCFRAYICVDEEASMMIRSVLTVGASIYLGASRGNGYGHCKLTNLRVLENNPENLYESTDSKVFYVLYCSDMIYLDDFGQTRSSINDTHISNLLGVECRMLQIATEPKTITGFNSKIGGRIPQFLGAKMGTVVKYGYDGELKTHLVEEFTNRSYGLRTQEGFGRVAVFSDFKYNEIVYNDTTNSKQQIVETNLLDETDKLMLYNISKSIFLNRLQMNMKKSIHSSKMLPLNKSKIAQWQMILSEMKSKSYSESIEHLDNLIKHINNSTNLDKNKKMKVFLEFKLEFGVTIEEFIRKSNTLECFKKMNILPEKIMLGNSGFDLEDNALYTWNISYLEQLLYYKRIQEKEVN